MNRRHFIAALGACALTPGAVLAKTKPMIPPNAPSRGLGITGKQWKQWYGKPDAHENGHFIYHNNGYDVRLLYLDDDAQMQTMNFQFAKPTPAEEAGFAVGLYMPTDAVQGEQTQLNDVEISILWHSDWLAQTQKPVLDGISLWPNANPGDYITILHGEGQEVTSVIVALGNNP